MHVGSFFKLPLKARVRRAIEPRLERFLSRVAAQVTLKAPGLSARLLPLRRTGEVYLTGAAEDNPLSSTQHPGARRLVQRRQAPYTTEQSLVGLCRDA